MTNQWNIFTRAVVIGVSLVFIGWLLHTIRPIIDPLIIAALLAYVVKADPRRRALIDLAGVKSLMTVPLISGSEPFGAIAIANKSTGTFGPNDERVLAVLASSAVIGLENARLYQAEYERKQQLQTLLEVTATATRSLDLDEPPT